MSAWSQMESWRAKQKDYTAQFESQANELMTALTTAFSSINDGRMQLTVNQAVATAQHRAAEQQSASGGDLLSGIDFSV